MSIELAVYADWPELLGPTRLGILHVSRLSSREIFEFEFDGAVLADPRFKQLHLDPRIGLFEGRQHPEQGRENFGLFLDACPDRWGRMLMRRRLDRDQRLGLAKKNAKLFESDYLLGVHDAFRVGALRFKLDDNGPFLDDCKTAAAPPFVQLRQLEAACLAIEQGDDNAVQDIDDWLRLLIAPGGSLGGARPKASVVDPDGHLWIAKFPSVNDQYNVGAWELVTHTLARSCGIQVPTSLGRRFASRHDTFLVQRFDRAQGGGRLHFASAMTMTGRQDGDDASTGASYFEIARVLMNHGSNPNEDLHELWLRIVFNIAVSNSDDHLRNHGFIFVPQKGWRLSPAFDMNPVPGSIGLKLNINMADNALDFELARQVAPYFRVSAKDSLQTIAMVKNIVAQWPNLAKKLTIAKRDQERMAAAFSQ